MATLAEILRQTGYAQDGKLTAPATDSPMTKALSEHIKTLPQQLATNQAALDSAIGSWNKTDFATGQPNPNYRPEAIQELTQLMPNIGGLTAWHGTPHKIQGAFDISKVGTGEGNQSFGYGMYFAENPNVAKQYQAALSDTKYKVGEKELKGNEAWAAQFLHDFQGDALPKRIDVNTAISKANETLKDTATKQEIVNKIKELDKAGLSVENGNLYKVDIPDEQIPTMLDWDKPLNQQSELVQNVAKDLLPKIKQVSPWIDLSKATGGDFYRAYQRYRGNYPDFASEGLNEAGIKGIRYLDEGSRVSPKYTGDIAYIHAGNDFKNNGYTLDEALKGMKQAYKNADAKELKDALGEVYGVKPNQTSNFVVFDPSTVKILEENSKPVSRKEIIEKQVKALKD
jgi:hypothetical protein